MSEPYLIAHKVRGEPAFDIAERMRCPICQGVSGHNVPDFETGIVSDYEGSPCYECDGEGYWWIIPTSGHRARPFWHVELFDNDFGLDIEEVLKRMPESLPDHYAINDRPLRSSPNAEAKGRSLLAQLGLAKPKPTITRRF